MEDNNKIKPDKNVLIVILILIAGIYFIYSNNQNKKQETVTKCQASSKKEVSKLNNVNFCTFSRDNESCKYSVVEEFDEELYNKCLKDAGITK